MDQKIVLKSLFLEDYRRECFHHLSEEFFEGGEKQFFSVFSNLYLKYSVVPDRDVMKNEIGKTKLPQSIRDNITALIDEVYDNPISQSNLEYAIKETEKWGLVRSVYNAMVNGIGEFEKTNPDFNSIYTSIRNAITYRFDMDEGHAYLADADQRYESYQIRDEKIPFGLSFEDSNTDGGFEKRSLMIVMAESGGGKSIRLADIAAKSLARGLNTLYISMELSEKKVGVRLDANLMDKEVWKVPKITKDSFESEIDILRSKTRGDIIIKQYPTSSASALDFRHLIDELALKKNWIPDIVVVDYLGIVAPARPSSNSNSYSQMKMVAEDLRALAVDYDVPVWSAVQVNRSAYGSSNIGMENTAESMAIVHTADFIEAIISPPELEECDQIIMKIIKNRFGPVDVSGVVGLSKSRMKLFDVDSTYNVSQTGKTSSDNQRNSHQSEPKQETEKPTLPNSRASKSRKFSEFQFG
jgi:replicative DNA helicase